MTFLIDFDIWIDVRFVYTKIILEAYHVSIINDRLTTQMSWSHNLQQQILYNTPSLLNIFNFVDLMVLLNIQFLYNGI